jgi:hypothetical protein
MQNNDGYIIEENKKAITNVSLNLSMFVFNKIYVIVAMF